jgi:HEAT repeat protein
MVQKALVDGIMKGRNEMFAENTYLSPEIVELKEENFISFPVAIPNREIALLAADFSHEVPWAERQRAARKLGQSRDPEALSFLLAALPEDPFWMVRCVMIQAVECIGDPKALPILNEVAHNDRFSAVRSAAKEAIERLS